MASVNYKDIIYAFDLYNVCINFMLNSKPICEFYSFAVNICFQAPGDLFSSAVRKDFNFDRFLGDIFTTVLARMFKTSKVSLTHRPHIYGSNKSINLSLKRLLFSIYSHIKQRRFCYMR